MDDTVPTSRLVILAGDSHVTTFDGLTYEQAAIRYELKGVNFAGEARGERFTVNDGAVLNPAIESLLSRYAVSGDNPPS